MTDAAGITSVEEWLKHNEPTRVMVTYWRPITSAKCTEKGLTLHPCDADGRPKCKCGKVAAKLGNLGPIRRMTQRPPQRCDMAGVFLGGAHNAAE